MHDVGVLCQRILEAFSTHDTSSYEQLLDELASYIHPFAEFSSAAAQAVREKGLLDHLSPLPSAPLVMELGVGQVTRASADSNAFVPRMEGGQL